MTAAWLAISAEVRAALERGQPVVALESSLIAQGLPPPHNLETAAAAEAAVRAGARSPATTALADGRVVVGRRPIPPRTPGRPRREPGKAGSRDLGPLLAARRAGLDDGQRHDADRPRGRHRGRGHRRHRWRAPRGRRTFDVSADIDELAATPVTVVCSGAKAILDLPATLELLESRRVPVVGLGTDELPAFYSRDQRAGPRAPR